MINLQHLPENFAAGLNPYVRDRYAELWKKSRKRYVTIWRQQIPAGAPQNIDELITAFPDSATTLEAMRQDGVVLAPIPQGGSGSGFVRLMTTDPNVAQKYDMHEESEYWDAPE